MYSLLIGAALLIIATMPSCNRNAITLSEHDISLIQAQVEETLNNYCSDKKEKGFLAELEYLDTSSLFFWIPPGHESPIDYDSVASLINANAPLYSMISNEWATLEVKVLSKDLASYAGQLHSFMIDTNGMSRKLRLMESGILVRRSKGWKFLHGQTSFL